MNTEIKAVAIPSGRGIRSGKVERNQDKVAVDCRNPLWSGHSFRLNSGISAAKNDREVAIPSGRGIRSGSSREVSPRTLRKCRNPLWSGHSFRLYLTMEPETFTVSLNVTAYGIGLGLVLVGWVAGLVISYVFSIIRGVGRLG